MRKCRDIFNAARPGGIELSPAGGTFGLSVDKSRRP